MPGMTHYTDNLSQLGAQTAAPTSPETAVLERVPNPHADTLYLARFTAPEFTSLCPVTSQPDFAHLVIDYVPGDWLVESKSLKLYLTSFRNHGAFHEDCTVAIGRKLVLMPKWDATEALRLWCAAPGIAVDPRITAQFIRGRDEPPPEGLRERLGVSAQEPLGYRLSGKIPRPCQTLLTKYLKPLTRLRDQIRKHPERRA